MYKNCNTLQWASSKVRFGSHISVGKYGKSRIIYQVKSMVPTEHTAWENAASTFS